jgi:DNA-binding NarL/FixJ family response regulator
VTERLGDQRFQEIAGTGRALSTDQTIALVESVLSAAEQPTGGVPDDKSPAFLTPREQEVLVLIVAGCSNTEIGDRLFISTRTAQTHVTHILAKLDVATRTEAAAKAVRQGLV